MGRVGGRAIKLFSLHLSSLAAGVACCFSATAQPAVPNPPRHVLILESFGRDVAPWSVITPAFKSELAARQFPSPIDFHQVAIETARENAPETEAAFSAYLRSLHPGKTPDLVVPVGAAAAQFWWKFRDKIFPDSPVVIAGIEQRIATALKLGTNDTAATVQFDFKSGPEIVLQVLPGTTNICCIVGNSVIERFWIAACQQAWAGMEERVSLTWLNTLSLEEICERAQSMPPQSVLAYGMFFVDGAGVPHDQIRALDRLYGVANAPIFGLFEEELGHGIVGGKLFSSQTIGLEAGRLADRVLRGEPAGRITPPVLSPSRPTFDWRELQRWGIPETRLPQGSVVRFREPTLWQSYRWYVLGAMGVIGLQGATIVGMLAQRARRRRAEDRLQESRQFMELAVEAGGLGLWVVDLHDTRLWMNSPMRSIFGFNREGKVEWKNILDRIHPADRRAAGESLRSLVREARPLQFEGRLQLPGGAEKWIVTRGLATRNDQDKPVRIQGIVADITARRTAELIEQRHRNEMSHIGRVHLLGQLSCALAHELNQPLGAILSNAEAAELLLQQGAVAPEDLKEILSDIRKDDQRASDVIQRMRALLRRGEMEMTPVPVGDMVKDCIRLTMPHAVEQNVTIDVEVAPENLCVRGDRVQLEQVLLNLLVNAMDALRDCPPERRHVLLWAKPIDASRVEFGVQDSGPGIRTEDLERVFDLFHTSKHDGLGVGLSISRTIIEGHNGRLWAENNKDGGATFRFTVSPCT